MSDRRSRAAQGRLVVDANRCHGCQACMIACSLVHERQVIPSRARIQIVLDLFSGSHEIIWCRQCRHAFCAEACPQEAIRLTPGGWWTVDPALCVGCGLCVDACPFHAIFVNNGLAVKCDTCDGQPACVESCPRGALTWREGS
ncbi:MAG: 4Fe-4S dicluster domain-containing protein [Anaerolineae bacterium]|nr:4Fe-4S dicluster domain-containing protein [Anaerolineae bacterium]